MLLIYDIVCYGRLIQKENIWMHNFYTVMLYYSWSSWIFEFSEVVFRFFGSSLLNKFIYCILHSQTFSIISALYHMQNNLVTSYLYIQNIKVPPESLPEKCACWFDHQKGVKKKENNGYLSHAPQSDSLNQLGVQCEKSRSACISVEAYVHFSILSTHWECLSANWALYVMGFVLDDRYIDSFS